MTDNKGSRASRGNLMKAIGKIIKLLEEIVALQRQLVNKDKSLLGNRPEELVEKDRYTNNTGTTKGTVR